MAIAKSTVTTKKPTPRRRTASVPKKPQGKTRVKTSSKPTKPSSKQDTVLSMLRHTNGTTITAIVKATGWQQHSVRGFFAGIVKKKLKLKLDSEKAGKDRTYRIVRPSAS